MSKVIMNSEKKTFKQSPHDDSRENSIDSSLIPIKERTFLPQEKGITRAKEE